MITGYIRNTDAPTEVSLSTTSANTQISNEGRYLITCDEDCYFLQGDSTVAATTASRRLWAGTYRLLDVTDASNYVAGIVASGTATLSIERV